MDEFQIPENISEVEDLAASAAEARAAYQAERDTADPERLSALVDHVEACGTEQTARDERAQQLADLDSRMTASEQPAEDDSGDQDGGDADGGEAPGEPEPESAPVGDQEASARRPSIADAARTGTIEQPSVPSRSERVGTGRLTAAAGFDGVRAGDDITFEDIGRIASERIDALVQMGRVGGARETSTLAQLRREFPPELTAREENVERMLDVATSMAALPGGRLEARVFDESSQSFAGGWCAPSETLYDRFCPVASLDGLWSSPEINATRGGVRWPVSPDFCEVYNGGGFVIVTEEMDAEGFTKPCIEVPCPTFQEERLDAVPLCIVGGLLQNNAYPESVANYVANVLAAHAHYLNAQKLARLEAASTAVTIAANFGAASQLLDAVGLAVQDLRDAYRMSDGELIEIVLPLWVREVLRADIGRRNGQVALDVSDEQINTWIRRRGAVPQYVYDWQPLGDAGIESPGDSPSEDCPPTPQTAFPTTVKFLAYRAGTWTTAVTDVINLNTFYDHSLVTENKYGIQFTETGFALMNSCPGSRVYTASICPDGATGGVDELACSSQPIT